MKPKFQILSQRKGDKMSKKGISLPINTLIIILLGVVALAVIIGSFMSSIRDSGDDMSYQSKLQNGCNLWVTRGCCEPEVSCTGNVPQQLKDGLKGIGMGQTASDADTYCCGD